MDISLDLGPQSAGETVVPPLARPEVRRVASPEFRRAMRVTQTARGGYAGGSLGVLIPKPIGGLRPRLLSATQTGGCAVGTEFSRCQVVDQFVGIVQVTAENIGLVFDDRAARARSAVPWLGRHARASRDACAVTHRRIALRRNLTHLAHKQT